MSQDLRHALLGPQFAQQTEDSLYAYVQSLREEKPVAAPKAPRLKKPAQIHIVNPGEQSCLVCGKRVKKVTAKCLGHKKPIDEPEGTCATPSV